MSMKWWNDYVSHTFLRHDITLSERVKRREETPTVHTILFHGSI